MRSTRGAGILSAGYDGFRYSYDTLGNDRACEIIRATIAADIKLFLSLITELYHRILGTLTIECHYVLYTENTIDSALCENVNVLLLYSISPRFIILTCGFFYTN